MSQPLSDSSVAALFGDSGIATVRGRSLAERSDLVLAFAQVIHVNGQSTYQTLVGAKGFGFRATIVAGWEDVQIRATDDNARLASFVAPSPTGVTWTESLAPSERSARLTAGAFRSPLQSRWSTTLHTDRRWRLGCLRLRPQKALPRYR